MKRSLRALFALMGMVLILLGMNPVRHLCTIAQQGSKWGGDPHACCRGAEGLVLAQAEPPAPVGPAAEQGSPLCDGDCCASASQGALPPSPDGADLQRGETETLEAGVLATQLRLPDPAGVQVAVHGPRGPPPRLPAEPLYIWNRVLLN